MNIQDLLKEHIDNSQIVKDYKKMIYYDASSVNKSDYVLVIRSTGGNGDQYVRNPSFDLFFVSKEKPNHSQIQDLGKVADQVKNYLIENFKYQCIIGIDAGEVFGPMSASDNRFRYQLNLNLITSGNVL